MNPRTTGILALVALSLGAFLYFYEIEGGRAREEAEERAKQLFPDVEAEDVTEITLTTQDGELAMLSRGEEGFRLTAPVEFPADTFAADGMASSLAGLSREAVLEDPSGPEEYGLAEEARVVRFLAGETSHVLRIGDQTPVGASSYVRVEGRDEVYTVPTFETQSFDKRLDDLREKRILAFDRTAIDRVTVRWPDSTVELVRSAPPEEGGDADAETDGGWRVVAPVESRADPEVVDQLLSDLSFLRADGFVDDPPDDAEAGLAPPVFEVELSGEAAEEGAEATVHRLAIGAVHEGDKRLVRAGRPSLYTIPAQRLGDFPRRVVAYRYKQLADYAMADAARVDFFFQPEEGDPVSVTAELGENAWRSSPEHVPSGRIARLVSELSSLKADDILMDEATEADLEGLGLSPPNAIVTVLGRRPEAAEGEEAAPPAPRLAELQIGEVEGSEWITVRAAGDPAVYRLDYELAEHLPVGLDAFRNRFVAAEPAAPPPEPPLSPEAAGEFLTPSEESP